MEKLKRTRVAAYALIVHEEQILLCRISSEIPEWEGFWTLPGGGIEFGEDPELAMIREVKEETGLDVVSESIAKIDSITINKDEEDFHGIRIIYNVKVVGGKITHEKSGTTDLCQWNPMTINKRNLVDLAVVGLEYAKTNLMEIEPNESIDSTPVSAPR